MVFIPNPPPLSDFQIPGAQRTGLLVRLQFCLDFRSASAKKKLFVQSEHHPGQCKRGADALPPNAFDFQVLAAQEAPERARGCWLTIPTQVCVCVQGRWGAVTQNKAPAVPGETFPPWHGSRYRMETKERKARIPGARRRSTQK